jgi:NAD+-dependent protein deacetylase sirtuin 2
MKCENNVCLKSSKDNRLKIVKPDITFFGEELPDEFMSNYTSDFANCDLLIVMGTSLQVQPFGSLSELVRRDCPRLLINNQLVGDFEFTIRAPDNYRDVHFKGNCDDGCLRLAELLGWKQELIEMFKKDHERIESEKENRTKVKM